MERQETAPGVPPFPLARLISGGQTGVDRLALDVAMSLGIPVGGWCPRGRRAEDGVIPERYPLREAASELYQERTRLNVRDSDVTLILCSGAPSGGTLLTIEMARTMHRPFYLADMFTASDEQLIDVLRRWLWDIRPSTLNVAGPRFSEWPQLEPQVTCLLRRCVVASSLPPPVWPPARPMTPSLPGTS